MELLRCGAAIEHFGDPFLDDLLAALRDRNNLAPRLALAGILLGAGGFNLYDGTIQHKLLGLHQVRAGVPDNLPYDLAFLAIAATLALAGALLLRRTRQPSA